MRTRVKTTWRTRILLFIAFVAAGIIAWLEVGAREQAERERPPPPPEDPDVIEVELVSPE